MLECAAALLRLDQFDAAEFSQHPYVVGKAADVDTQLLGDLVRALWRIVKELQGTCPERVGKRSSQTSITRSLVSFAHSTSHPSRFPDRARP